MKNEVKEKVEKTESFLKKLNRDLREVELSLGFELVKKLDIASKISILQISRDVNLTKQQQQNKIMVLNNQRLVHHIVNTKINDINTELKKDLVQYGNIGLIKAANTFDKSKGIKFSSYAGRCIYNEIMMYMRASKKFKKEVAISNMPPNKMFDEFENLDAEIMLSVANVDENDFTGKPEKFIQTKMDLNKLKELYHGDFFSEKEKYILDEYYTKNKTQTQIAEELGMSQNGISRICLDIAIKVKQEVGYDEVNSLNKMRQQVNIKYRFDGKLTADMLNDLQLDYKQKEIYGLYVFKNLTLAQCAEMFGYSKQNIDRILRRGYECIKNQIEKQKIVL